MCAREITCDLAVSHLAGCRNTEADALSRVNCPEVPDALTDPAFWQRFTDGRKVEVLAGDLWEPWLMFKGFGPMRPA